MFIFILLLVIISLVTLFKWFELRDIDRYYLSAYANNQILDKISLHKKKKVYGWTTLIGIILLVAFSVSALLPTTEEKLQKAVGKGDYKTVQSIVEGKDAGEILINGKLLNELLSKNCSGYGTYNVEIAKLLVNKGAQFKSDEINGMLYNANYYKYTDMANYLVSMGATTKPVATAQPSTTLPTVVASAPQSNQSQTPVKPQPVATASNTAQSTTQNTLNFSNVSVESWDSSGNACRFTITATNTINKVVNIYFNDFSLKISSGSKKPVSSSWSGGFWNGSYYDGKSSKELLPGESVKISMDFDTYERGSSNGYVLYYIQGSTPIVVYQF